jgi:hypothetical protein
MVVCAGLLLLGAVIAALTIRNPAVVAHAALPQRQRHCGIEGPPVQAETAPARAAPG